ncbi:MAG: large subunit ribosomal protein [Patescibacteria group bacterium]|nr:large subunit ribosomal protein [Patescibacteria group bacterium]
MTIIATQKYARQTARKVRLVANSVRKMPLEAAVRQLGVMDRTASILVLKVVRQAVANAMNNHGLKFEELELKNITVDGAATYKRFRAASRGRGNSVFKRSCHVTVTLEKPEVAASAPNAAAKKAEPVTAETTEKKEVKPVVKKTAAPKVAKKAESKTKKVSTK